MTNPTPPQFPTQHLIAVADGKKNKGVYGPDRNGIWVPWDDRFAQPFRDNAPVPRAVYEVGPYDIFLRREWPEHDMYAVTGIVFGPNGIPLDWQPRVNSDRPSGLVHIRTLGYQIWHSVMFVDIDNPDHCDWTKKLLEEFIEQWETNGLLKNVGIYHTPHGWRIYLLLNRWVLSEEFAASLRGYIRALERSGIKGVDRVCSSWNSLFGLPNVCRKGILTYPQAWPWHGERAVPSDLPAPLDEPKALRSQRAVRERLETYTDDVREHSLLLLAQRKGLLICKKNERDYAISCPFGPHKGGYISKTIVRDGSVIICKADQCHKRTLAEFEASMEAMDDKFVPTTPDASLSEEQMYRFLTPIFAEYVEGVRIIDADTGSGKTRGALTLCERRAAEWQYTGIVTPTNDLNVEICKDLDSLGVPWGRFQAPQSILGPDGKPLCKIPGIANLYAGGGMPVPYAICSKCKWEETCTVKTGFVGDPNAYVIIGNHNLIKKVVAHIGLRGVLVGDETIEPTEQKTVPLQWIGEFHKYANTFDPQYHRGLLASANVLLALAETHKASSELVDPTDAMAGVPRVPLFDVRRKGVNYPNVLKEVIHDDVRSDNDIKAALTSERAMTAWVIQKLYDGTAQGFAEGRTPQLRFHDHPYTKHRMVTVLLDNPHFIAAMTHRSTIYMGAGVSSQIKDIERLHGSMDGRVYKADVKSTCGTVKKHSMRDANKSNMYVNNLPDWREDGDLVRMMRDAFGDANCLPKGKMLLVSLKEVAIQLRLVLASVNGIHDRISEKISHSMGIHDADQAACERVMRPLVQACIHYLSIDWHGHLKGTNKYKDYTICFTAMDQFPNPDALAAEFGFRYGSLTREQLAYLGIQKARDQNGQAHGRVRVTWRSPGDVVYFNHYGRVLSSNENFWRTGDYTLEEPKKRSKAL